MIRTLPRLLLCMTLGASLCMAGGCADKQNKKSLRNIFAPHPKNKTSKKNQTDLPRLDELTRSDQTSRTPLLDSGVVAGAVLTRVWLPADQTVNELWREVSTSTLSEVELLVWHRNQLRAALVSRKKLDELLAKVPAHFGVEQQLMTLSGDLMTMEPANTKAAQLPVSIEMLGQTKVYTGGRMQLLIAADPQVVAQTGPKVSTQAGADSLETMKLTIVPHQYVPRVTLIPRDHLEAALDGEIFTPLMLRVLIRPSQVLLIAPDVPTAVFDDTRPLHEPAPQGEVTKQSQDSGASESAVLPVSPAEAADGAETADTNAESADVNQVLEIPPLSTAPERKPVAYGLGQAILTGRQRGQLLYQLLIFEVRGVQTPELTR